MNTIYDTYKKMWHDYTHGIITEKEWSGFCMKVLEYLMITNKDILESMKNEEW